MARSFTSITIGAWHLAAEKPWLADHPHLHFGPDPRNTIYVATDRLVLPGVGDTGLPGAGEMKRFDVGRSLTAPGAPRRSVLALPFWFTSEDAGALTYNAAPRRWSKTDHGVLLDAATRGQEFVLDCARRPFARAWIKERLS